MCGIAGILGLNNKMNCEALRRMSQAMYHRGPDGDGVWVSQRTDEAGRGCLLAHRRLSILDTSPAAGQPLVDPHGPVIVFNGEIYNFRELRVALEARGETFQSSGDTAVLLRILSVEGQDAVRKLRGMFAFGLWDDAKRQLLLARDPLGIKPLYLARNPSPSGDWSLIFASELRTILASGLIEKPKAESAAVASVLWNGYVAGPGTIVRGIDLLPPGETHIFDVSGRLIQREQFWRMPTADQTKPADGREVRDALRESVRRHLISDVPLALFFSGGIDSSAVANLRKSQPIVRSTRLRWRSKKRATTRAKLPDRSPEQSARSTKRLS